MYSLLIDTHDTNINLILYENNLVKDIFQKKSTNSHSIYLMPMIVEILKRNLISKNDINEIYVVNGPGSFTGIRIGVTVAKTWAFVKNIKIKVINSLEMLSCFDGFNDNQLLAISDNKGYYIGDFKQKKFYYLNKSEIDDKKLLLEEKINVNYNLVFEYIKNLPYINPHLVNPIYIKKIGIGND